MNRFSRTRNAATAGSASARSAVFSRDEIARLAFLNWRHDGCPAGCDREYWLEAEAQIKATWHLLASAERAAEAAEPAGQDGPQELVITISSAGSAWLEAESAAGGPRQSFSFRRRKRAGGPG
jgi:hypothetical protein